MLGERDSGDCERLTARKSCVILELRLDLETTCFSGDAAFCIPSPAIVPKDPANEASDYKHGVITIPRDPANCVVPRAKGTDEINSNGRPLCVKHLKPLECTRIKRKRWFTRRVQYYPNSDASFNFMALTIQLSGDIHPLPGPNTNTSTTSRIPARITSNRRNTNKPTPRHRVESNCIKIDTIDTQAMNLRNGETTQQFKHGGQHKRLKIAHLNAESLKNRTRFTEIREMALRNDFDILSFSETWFNTSVTNASVHIDGYKIYRLDRLRKRGGGICAYIKTNLKAKIHKDLTGITDSGLHQLWLQVQHKKLKSLLVCVVYRPPDNPITSLEGDLLQKYTQALSLNKDIVLLGDLNCDLLSDNPKSKALRSFCAAANATQLIKDPTRVTKSSSSLIDVILVSKPDLVKSSGVMDLTMSDHFLVFAVLNLKVPKPAATYITIRSFKNYDADLFSSDISHVPWNTVDLVGSVNEKLNAFNDLFLACLDKHAPVKTVKLKHRPNPFIGDEIRQLITSRNALHKKARQSGSPADWEEFKKLRRETKYSIRKAEADYFNQEVIANKNNARSIWKTVRRALPRNRNQNLQYTKDTCVLAEEFNRFFTSVSARAASASKELAKSQELRTFDIPPAPNTPCMLPADESFCFQQVSCAYVEKVITHMPSNKAPGYDKVPLSVVKDCLPRILPTITKLINCSFESGTFPHAWKRAEVVPHLKDGDHEVADNNRPISLLPALSKVAEKIALSQYTDYLSRENRLTKHQSGNRKLHSTETLSLLVTDQIFRAMDDKQVTVMVLIDLSKAFDSISHSSLLSKLCNFGTSESALRWFESYLVERQQTTRIGTSLSPPLTVTHGVPQGSILGPALFTLYMNDLPTVTRFCDVESYVDDTKIYLSFPPKDIRESLSKVERDLHRVAEWCCSNHLLINPAKTKLMFFGTQQILSKIPNVTVPFLGKKLTPILSCKDLGVTLDSSLSFNAHIKHLSSSLLATLSQISRVRHLFSQDVLLQILNSLVFSKLFYCSTVWSGTTKQNIYKLQLLQNFAARIVTGTNKFNHISPALKELGWLPVADLLHLRDVAMVYKCLNGLTPTYLSSKLVKRSTIHSHHTRQEDHIHIPYCRTTTAQQSFFYHALCSWNQLSTDTKSSKDMHSFKRNAKKEIAK